MFLKSLQIKGFKSFADKTVLDLEPGVTVVIGPNGSGKSNVVDAVAWVLGAQGARALRGAKMDDVIFAGTANRPALGRAEVSLTIDNTSGTLPIDFSEVTITRRLFRTGDSDYEINGAPCRLLDIQDLLSDTGIGRQQHVIVGQGQLDQVLNARPEDRRSIIEEAAGVLKYRKRKEKAERRLEATEGNLLRLSDLLREVRRQLRPLERQAEAARRYDGLVSELRAVRLHLLGREIDQLRVRQTRATEQRATLGRDESELRTRLRGLDAQVVEAEQMLSVSGRDDAAELLLRVESARERARGLQALVTERHRGIERELLAAADEGVVENLVSDAAAVRAELAQVDTDFDSLAPTHDEVEQAETRVRTLREALEAAAANTGPLAPLAQERAAAEDALEKVSAAWREADSECTALRKQLENLQRDEPRLRAELAEVEQALARVAPERGALEHDEADVAAQRVRLEQESAVEPDATPEGRERRAAEQAAEVATQRLQHAQAEAGQWRARADTLAMALDEAHAAAGGAAIEGLGGVLGPVVDHLRIEAGAEVAIAAALGDLLHAVVLDGTSAARGAVDRLKSGDASALLLVLDARVHTNGSAAGLVPAGTRALADCVKADRPALESALRAALANVVLTDGWEQALDLALADPNVVAVTPEGDRFGGGSVWRAGPTGRSAVTPAALDDAREHAVAAEAEQAAAQESMQTARERLQQARRTEQAAADGRRKARQDLDRALDAVTRRRREFERRTAGLDAKQAQLRERLDSITIDVSGLPAAHDQANERRVAAEADVELARQRVAAARRAELSAAESMRTLQSELDRVRAATATLRRDYEVRGAAIEARRTGLNQRLVEIERRLAARPDEEAAAQARRAILVEKQDRIAALGEQLAAQLAGADELAERLREQRRRESEAARAAGARLDALRTDRSASERALAECRERLQRLDIETAETTMRLENSVEQSRREFDCEPEVAIEAPAPEIAENMTLPQLSRDLERELRLMGPVNPLALSEYEALLERHEFLQQQLDDVKKSRRELHRVIQAVNAEIITVFESAFTDVARHFEALFALLFPGGSGRLLLSNPEDLLGTGIEVEARPSGKTPRRLSLLSGGERSLAALAFLFAVFRARPSPFYLLDEVEAALDDVNLHRFLDLVHEFREEAQLLIVSHQKRTMESADVLYGVSMPPGGSSRVVSQRVRDLQHHDV